MMPHVLAVFPMPEPLRWNTGLKWNTPGLTWNGFVPEPPNTTTTTTTTMNQNLVELNITDADWTEIDAALAVIETKLGAKLIDLTPAQRQSLNKMGEKSESFCRESLVVGRQNVAELTTRAATRLTTAEGDLVGHDKLRPRLARLTSLQEKADDTEMALGSDVMEYALFQYGFLSAIGAGAGLDDLYDQLGSRFIKTPTPEPPAPTP